MHKIIQQPDSVFQDLMDFKRAMRDETFHPSSFLIRQEVPEGLLLFHTLTCELLLVDKDRELVSDEYMKEHLFVVPESMDEYKLVRQYRTLRLMVDKEEDETTSSYTIMTTTDCNARCFYCYEKGRSRIPMSAETAMKVADLIEKNYRKQSSEESAVSLHWFGGEPLYNSKVIDLICSELEKKKVPFKSGMISNGYLFDEKTVKKAAEQWKLKSVQITLDGTEYVYNTSKAFIYKNSVSPYQRVVRNIGLLLDAEIKVVVRLNLGLHNADDLFVLVRSLADLYSGKKGFSCYAHVLFEESAGSNNIKLTDESRALVYEKLAELETLMVELGIKPKEVPLPKEIKRNWCMADSGKSIMIAPTGDIGLCEHYSEDNFFSHIDTPDVVDKAMVAKFKAHREEIELCNKCPIYPQCVRLEMCEEAATCNVEKMTDQVNSLKTAMVQKYEKYKKENETEV